jgi:hypothetical protein
MAIVPRTKYGFGYRVTLKRAEVAAIDQIDSLRKTFCFLRSESRLISGTHQVPIRDIVIVFTASIQRGFQEPSFRKKKADQSTSNPQRKRFNHDNDPDREIPRREFVHDTLDCNFVSKRRACRRQRVCPLEAHMSILPTKKQNSKQKPSRPTRRYKKIGKQH